MFNSLFQFNHRKKFQIEYLFPAVLVKGDDSFLDVTCKILTDEQTYTPFAFSPPPPPLPTVIFIR